MIDSAKKKCTLTMYQKFSFCNNYITIVFNIIAYNNIKLLSLNLIRLELK